LLSIRDAAQAVKNYGITMEEVRLKLLGVAFILGAFLFAVSVTGPYPLLRAGPALLCVAAVFIVAGKILFSNPKPERISFGYATLVLLPWLLAALILMNGALDPEHEILHETVVVKQDFYSPWDVLTVRSWRPGRSTEALYIKTGFSFNSGKWSYTGAFFMSGKPVVIGVKPGAFGIPWISRISQGHNDFYYPRGPAGGQAGSVYKPAEAEISLTQ
jgi:hypothetical protein